MSQTQNLTNQMKKTIWLRSWEGLELYLNYPSSHFPKSENSNRPGSSYLHILHESLSTRINKRLISIMKGPWVHGYLVYWVIGYTNNLIEFSQTGNRFYQGSVEGIPRGPSTRGDNLIREGPVSFRHPGTLPSSGPLQLG